MCNNLNEKDRKECAQLTSSSSSSSWAAAAALVSGMAGAGWGALNFSAAWISKKAKQQSTKA